MKKILLFSGLLFLIACSTIRKNFNKNKSRVDSTAKVVSKAMVLNKKDSSGSGVIRINEETKTDGGYSKITTIKEYLSDEFDFGGTVAKDSPYTVLPGMHINSAGKKKPVLIRETTIKEKGKARTQTQKITESATTSKVNNSDSSSNKNTSEIALKKDTKTVLESIDKKKFLPGLMIGIIMLGITYCIYKYFEK